jgi:hypothetical protein
VTRPAYAVRNAANELPADATPEQCLAAINAAIDAVRRAALPPEPTEPGTVVRVRSKSGEVYYRLAAAANGRVPAWFPLTWMVFAPTPWERLCAAGIPEVMVPASKVADLEATVASLEAERSRLVNHRCTADNPKEPS